MNKYLVILALAVLSFGCAHRHQERVLINFDPDIPEKIIRSRLLAEPIPFPKETPFDSDARKLEAYRNGFHLAWDCIASGVALHGTPVISKPVGFEEAWDLGWKDGNKISCERWMQEYEKWRKEKASQPNSSP